MSHFNFYLSGKRIKIRCAETYDAEFTIKIRNDESKAPFFPSKLDQTVSGQEEWIKRQNAKTGDFFFIVEKLSDNSPLGTISIYDVDYIKKRAEYGRWISFGGPLENLEAAMMVHEFGFNILELDEIYSYTMKKNINVIGINKKIGAQIEIDSVIKDGYEYVKLVHSANSFNANKGKILKLIGIV